MIKIIRFKTRNWNWNIEKNFERKKIISNENIWNINI